MDDLSLEELQAALLDVQERKTATRLSERNVVELVNKLREVGLLGADLLHTIDGREYITTSQLSEEVQRAVASSRGRVAVVDLPAQLGVDIAHCERQALAAVESSGGKLQLLQGELIHESYFDTVAAEVDELVQESGLLTLADAAKRFKLGADLVQSTISARLDSSIHGRLESGILYTDFYIARIKAKLRGALRGASSPVTLAALTKKWELQTVSSTAQTLAGLVEELLKEKAIFGSLKAGIFVPLQYSVSQQEAAHSFYAQNFYIEYSMLERMGFPQGRSHMASAFPDGLALEAVYAAPQLRAQLDAAAEEASSSGSWLDAETVLPSALGAADVESLLQSSLRLQGGAGNGLQQMAGTCAVSAKLIDDIRQRCLALAREVADADLKRRRESSAAASASTPAAESGSSKPGHARATPEADSDDDWDTGKGKKKKGGRRKSVPKSGKSGSSAQPQKASAKAKGGPAAPASTSPIELLSLEVLSDRIEAWLTEAADAGDATLLARELATGVQPEAVHEFEKAVAAVFLAGAEARRRQQDGLARRISDAWQKLQLYEHGAALASGDEACSAALQRHLLRGLAQQLLDLLLHYLQASVLSGAEVEGPTESSGQPREAFATPAARAAVLKSLPADLGPSVTAADKAVNGTDLPAACEALLAACTAAGLQLRKLDKRAEKALVQEHRAALREQLSSSSEPAEALTLVVPLLIAQVHGRALSIPGKALAGALELLNGELEPPDFKSLLQFHSKVVQKLKASSVEVEADLATSLPDIKRIAGVAEAEDSSLTHV